MIELIYTEKTRKEEEFELIYNGIIMSVDDMKAYIQRNGALNERVGFVVPFSVYRRACNIADLLNELINNKNKLARGRFKNCA